MSIWKRGFGRKQTQNPVILEENSPFSLTVYNKTKTKEESPPQKKTKSNKKK